MSRLTWFSLLTTALAVGYLGGYILFRDPSVFAQSTPQVATFDMTAGKVSPRALTRGWSNPDKSGTWSNGADAEVVLEVTKAPNSDIELIFDLLSQAPPKWAQNIIRVPVTLNGAAAGALTFSGLETASRHRLVLPRSLVQGQKSFKIGFTFDGLETGLEDRVAFGLRRIALRDVSALAGFVGSVDGCIADGVVGWAVASDGPSPILLKVNGEAVPASVMTLERPDLKPLGLPTDAGFSLRFAKAPAAGSSIDIVFPNGEKLLNSPCRI